jgi:hypothetical protein
MTWSNKTQRMSRPVVIIVRITSSLFLSLLLGIFFQRLYKFAISITLFNKIARNGNCFTKIHKALYTIKGRTSVVYTVATFQKDVTYSSFSKVLQLQHDF